MTDLAIFLIGSLVGIAVFFFLRASHWKRRYLDLIDDAFERSARAVAAEDAGKPIANVTFKAFNRR
jgi:hypothetical protein